MGASLWQRSLPNGPVLLSMYVDFIIQDSKGFPQLGTMLYMTVCLFIYLYISANGTVRRGALSFERDSRLTTVGDTEIPRVERRLLAPLPKRGR